MSVEELMWLAKQATERSLIIEFGSYLGRSSAALAENTPGAVICVDNWSAYCVYEDGNICPHLEDNSLARFLQNVDVYIRNYKLLPVILDIETFYTLYPAFHGKADMVFIDADHRYEYVKRDIGIGKQLLRKGGLLCGHDYEMASWPGVKRAVDELLPTAKREIDYIWSIQIDT